MIVRLPIRDGAYADIEIVTLQSAIATIRLTYQGESSNNYPALSPTPESLKQAFRDLSLAIATSRNRLAQLADEYQNLVKNDDARQKKFPYVDSIQSLDQQRATDSRKMGVKAPISPRVMRGEMLQLRLPSEFGKELSVRDLGNVRDISIYNPSL